MHRVLVRNGLVKPQEQLRKRKYRRWQRDAPIQLWQLDIVGGIPRPTGAKHLHGVRGAVGWASDRSAPIGKPCGNT